MSSTSWKLTTGSYLRNQRRRMKTSSFHHQCQRSSLSPGCQRVRTGAWTQLWTSSGKKPENVWWQPSERHQYDRTRPQKAQTASKSTSQRPRPASESEPANWSSSKIQTHFKRLTQRHKNKFETNTQMFYGCTEAWSQGHRGVTGHRRTIMNNADHHPAAMGLK